MEVNIAHFIESAIEILRELNAKKEAEYRTLLYQLWSEELGEEKRE